MIRAPGLQRSEKSDEVIMQMRGVGGSVTEAQRFGPRVKRSGPVTISDQQHTHASTGVTFAPECLQTLKSAIRSMISAGNEFVRDLSKQNFSS